MLCSIWKGNFDLGPFTGIQDLTSYRDMFRKDANALCGAARMDTRKIASALSLPAREVTSCTTKSGSPMISLLATVESNELATSLSVP